jgi:ribosome biogenesis protein UTP30
MTRFLRSFPENKFASNRILSLESMSPTLIDAHLSTSQSQLAINALLKHSQKAKEKNEERELLGGREEAIWLVVAVKRMHPEKKLKPYTMCVVFLFFGSPSLYDARSPLAHPLIDPRVTSICLITKDPQRQYKDLLEEKGVKFISRVVGIEKLKGKFKPFEARRQLLQDHGFFMADERVIPVLPRLLGKMWFDAKK